MTKKLSDLKVRIMSVEHTAEEWLKLSDEVDEALLQASEDETQDFVDSGAGEILDMTCSAIRAIRDNN